MTRVPFRGVFAGVAGAWLATLGACGRTAPTLDDTFGYGDDDTALTGGTGGARGGSSARGGTTSTGGSSRGGNTSSTGGSVNDGGTSGKGAGAGPARGGSSFGGTAGNTDDGGSFGVGGSVSDGGSVAVGGSFAVGGSIGLGGTTGRGGSAGATAGGTTSNGGSGAQGGTSGTGPMTSISCGDEVCVPGESVCCSRRSQPSYCTDSGTNCPGATLTCSGPGQCAEGEVCCYHARFSSCTADCEVSEGAGGDPPTIVLCDSSADCGPDQTCVLAPRGIAYCGENL
jgi:hypothetical protein